MIHCEHCKQFARREEESKLPYDHLKVFRFSSQPESEQMPSPPQSDPAPEASTAKSDEIGSSRWVETAEDQKVIDKLEKDLEF